MRILAQIDAADLMQNMLVHGNPLLKCCLSPTADTSAHLLIVFPLNSVYVVFCIPENQELHAVSYFTQLVRHSIC